MIGVRLMDHLIDQDHKEIENIDLSVGSYLSHYAICKLGAFNNSNQAFASLIKDYSDIMKIQVMEVRKPAKNLADWYLYASIKSGQIIESFASVSCIVGDVQDAINCSRTFARGISTIVMIADDLIDFFKYNQTIGNLGYMIQNNIVSMVEVKQLIEKLYYESKEALKDKPVVFDVNFILDKYTNDLIDNIIPLYSKEIVSQELINSYRKI